MSNPNTARRARVGGAARARAELVESRLKRFPAPYAAKVRALAAQHCALADLSFSFPALLHHLAVTRGQTQAVVAGRPLREIAAALKLPFWLRGLPPEAFVRPLPPLPDGALFARRIANHPPRSPKDAAAWLQHVAFAARWGDDNVAVWVAQEYARAPRRFEPARLKLVCLWAWHSARPETKAGALCVKRWSPRATFSRAVEDAQDWLASVELAGALGQGVADGWLAPGRHGGFEFTPLLTAADVIEQARDMRNCVRSYGGALREGRCRLWTVRRDDEFVATVEIGAPQGGRLVTLREAHARANRMTAPEVERAIHEWVRSQPLHQAPAPGEGGRTLDRETWVSLWRDYWLAKRALPLWLPLSPAAGALRRLRQGRDVG